MIWKGNKDNGPIYGALIDIGSGTIGIAIVMSDFKEKLPRIIFSHRNGIRVGEKSKDQDTSLRRVQEALLSTSLILSGEGMQALHSLDPHGRISRVNVTCSSPWSYTAQRTVNYVSDEPFKITKAMIDDLISNAEEEILTHVRKDSPFNGEGFEIVERATVDVSVNEYPVRDPLLLKGTSVSLSHIAGLIPKDIRATLHEIRDKVFPDCELRVHTYMLVMYCVMRDIFPDVHSLCLVDVTGEATEFGIVQNDLLQENSFIPYGNNSFVRDVMEATGKPQTDVLTNIRAYGDDAQLEPSDLKEHMKEYEESVAKALDQVIERFVLPTNVILTTHHPYEKIFKHVFETAFESVLQKKIFVASIDPSMLEEVSQGIDTDIYLILSARFFHKLHGCAEIKD